MAWGPELNKDEENALSTGVFCFVNCLIVLFLKFLLIKVSM